MVQDQLVEYIASQLKLGVSRDAVKAALVGAGWQAADVEETLKKVEDAAKSAPPAKPAAGGMPQPASIKVSDLLSASSSATAFKMSSPAAGAAGATPAAPVTPAKPAAASPAVKNIPAASMPAGGHGGHITMYVLGAAIVAVGALAGYLYVENSGLTGKVAMLGGESANVASRLASLNAQVQALNASNTALAAQAASLGAENKDLKTNLSFVAAPPRASTSSEAVSVSGTLSGSGKTSFKLTTPYGVTVYVGNSKDAKVSAALAPLVLGTSSVMLTGTRVPGSQYLTVTGVNGSALQ